MKPRVIKTEAEYETALAYLEPLMDAKPGSTTERELELWALLVEDYEKRHHPIDDPDPIEAIKFRMDQLGMQQKDLKDIIPAKSKISEVMNRKRSLSLPMIRGFHRHLGIPAEVLLKETKTATKPHRPGKTKKSREKVGA